MHSITLVSEDPGYEAILERYRSELPINIYSKLIKTSTRGKLTALRQFVSNG